MSDQKPFVAYAVAIVMLMELVDGSALNTSLPQMAASFDVNPISLKVAITVYLLTLGLFVPASTWVAERFGTKRILLISAIGFILSSVLCGLSTNLTMLVVSRALQGFFGAFTMPVARMILVRVYKKNLLYAMTIMGSILTIGPMLGPLIGGGITTYLNWRYIFFINVPIGLFAFVLAWRFVPKVDGKKQDFGFDYLGFVLLGIAIASLMFVLDTVIDHSISNTLKIIVLIIAIILLVLYLIYARYKQQGAIVNLNIFHHQSFNALVLVSIMVRLSTMGLMFMLPLYLQIHHGFNAFEAGLAFMAFMIPAWLVKRVVKPILKTIGLYRYMLIIIALMCFSYLGLAWLFSHFDFVLYLGLLVVIGASFGCFTMVTNSSIYSTVNDDEIGVSSVIMSAVIQLSSAFAVAWVATLLATFSNVFELSAHSTITLHAFSYVMIFCALGMFMAAIYLFFCQQTRRLIGIQLT